jgi:hypothetical protein
MYFYILFEVAHTSEVWKFKLLSFNWMFIKVNSEEVQEEVLRSRGASSRDEEEELRMQMRNIDLNNAFSGSPERQNEDSSSRERAVPERTVPEQYQNRSNPAGSDLKLIDNNIGVNNTKSSREEDLKHSKTLKSKTNRCGFGCEGSSSVHKGIDKGQKGSFNKGSFKSDRGSFKSDQSFKSRKEDGDTNSGKDSRKQGYILSFNQEYEAMFWGECDDEQYLEKQSVYAAGTTSHASGRGSTCPRCRCGDKCGDRCDRYGGDYDGDGVPDAASQDSCEEEKLSQTEEKLKANTERLTNHEENCSEACCEGSCQGGDNQSFESVLEPKGKQLCKSGGKVCKSGGKVCNMNGKKASTKNCTQNVTQNCTQNLTQNCNINSAECITRGVANATNFSLKKPKAAGAQADKVTNKGGNLKEKVTAEGKTGKVTGKVTGKKSSNNNVVLYASINDFRALGEDLTGEKNGKNGNKNGNKNGKNGKNGNKKPKRNSHLSRRCSKNGCTIRSEGSAGSSEVERRPGSRGSQNKDMNSSQNSELKLSLESLEKVGLITLSYLFIYAVGVSSVSYAILM